MQAGLSLAKLNLGKVKNYQHSLWTIKGSMARFSKRGQTKTIDIWGKWGQWGQWGQYIY